MAKLKNIADKVRSKNAGPFWLTVDIFCGSEQRYRHILETLTTEQVAKTFGSKVTEIKRFDIDDLLVVKFSLPRPTVQGAINDRDMHGASWAALLGEIELQNL